MRRRRPVVALCLVLALAAGCSRGDETTDDGGSRVTPAPSSSPADRPTDRPDDQERAGRVTMTASPAPTRPGTTLRERPAPRPVSVLGLAAQQHRGDRLRLGAVRERTAAYTSYDVSYRSRSTTPSGAESYRITGVLNVPSGKGPFPAVVLAHGYIDPAVYVRGQGMTRERGYLAARGYLALHVDYRNHAGSDEDPRLRTRLRLGYSADVINAVKALRATKEVPVADDRIALFGRSMGGGVVQKALIAEPGLVAAAAAWASVSSWEPENYREFIRPDPEDSDLRDALARRYGLPRENPDFWRANSSRPFLGRITEPVLLVHGRYDDTCPPAWAAATHRAMRAAGVDAQLAWYADGHAFGPAFPAAMERTVRFLDARLGG